MRKSYQVLLSIFFILTPLYLGFLFWSSTRDHFTPTPYEYLEVNEPDVLGENTEPTVKIPVLMYHNIAPVPRTGSVNYRGLFVSPSMFEKQMKYLKENGYKTLTPQEFYDILKSGKNPHKKSVLITFDDGSRGQYKYAYPVLKKYKMTATFYIIADRSPIKKSELKEMVKNGMIVDSHTSTHRDLKKLQGTKNFKFQLVDSKEKLEKTTGQKIVSIAYPGCVADKRSFEMIKKNDYLLGFSCGRTITHRYSRRFYLSRVHVYSDMERFKKALTKGL